jgi:hypothetical protein
LVKQLLIAASLIDAEQGKFRQNSPPSRGRWEPPGLSMCLIRLAMSLTTLFGRSKFEAFWFRHPAGRGLGSSLRRRADVIVERRDQSRL